MYVCMYVCMYVYVYKRSELCSLLYMCPHTAIQVSSYCCISVLTLLYMSHCYTCVLILLYMSSYCIICVLILFFWGGTQLYRKQVLDALCADARHRTQQGVLLLVNAAWKRAVSAVRAPPLSLSLSPSLYFYYIYKCIFI